MTTLRTRRAPPPFRRVEVASVAIRSPRLVRVTLAGPELAGFELGLPAGSVRLLLPHEGEAEVVLPRWNGNEFLDEDGARPTIRTLTPLRFDAATNQLDVEIVRHGDGPLSMWAEEVAAGARAAVSGTGRGYDVDDDAPAFVLAGDESALPAISVLLPALPAGADVRVLVEVADGSARIDLPAGPTASVTWHEASPGALPGDAIVTAVERLELASGTRVWAAGEAASMQRIRRHLFERRGIPRVHAAVRGYWKVGSGQVDAS